MCYIYPWPKEHKKRLNKNEEKHPLLENNLYMI